MNDAQTTRTSRMGCRRLGAGPGACGPIGRFGGGPFGPRRVPVNIEETGDAFVLALHAAGLQREKLDMSVKDDVLTVAYRGDAGGDVPAAVEGRFTRREAENHAFERQFALKGKVVVDAITASYVDGVLILTLPKNPQNNQPAQKINLQ